MNRLTALVRAISTAILLLRIAFGVFRRLLARPEATPRERVIPENQTSARAEWSVVLLFLSAALAAMSFVVLYAADVVDTQVLGLALGIALALIAAAFGVIAKRLVPLERETATYAELDRGEEEQLVQVIEESPGGINRRRLIAGAGAAAGGALGLSLLAPAASLGPFLDTESLYDSPWQAGRRVVDDRGRTYRADEITEGAFYSGYPDGADRDELGSPIVIVRLDLSQLDLPPERRDWAPEGIVAYSKICTHAGCAVGLYRNPLFPQAEARPALVCPCHYSTFDPADGGSVLFGPAGRNLPQLPLQLGQGGELQAAGNFSGPAGPSFWGIRTRRPRTS